jgi:intracellular multiplication protein IcmL
MLKLPFKNLFESKTDQDLSPDPDAKETLPSCEKCPAMFSMVQNCQGLDTVTESRIWYHDQYKRAVSFALLIVVALIFSLIMNCVQLFSQPSPKYYALTHDLRVVELTPTDTANISQAKLINWVSETICTTFTFDFLNYRHVLMDVRPNYTKGAFDGIVKSLETSGNLELVKTKRLVTRASLKGAPVIVKEGVRKGYRMWKIELPIIISYESSQGVEASQDLIGTVVVSREDERQVPRGVLIHQLILKNK